MLHLAGAGVLQDRIEAYAWLGLAAEPGERDARDLAPGLQAELSDAEREQARDRAHRYRPRPLQPSLACFGSNRHDPYGNHRP